MLFTRQALGLVILIITLLALIFHEQKRRSWHIQEGMQSTLARLRQGRIIRRLLLEARSRQERGYRHEAIEPFITKALEDGRNLPWALDEAAHIYVRLEQPKKAKQVLLSRIRLHPPAYQALFLVHRIDHPSLLDLSVSSALIRLHERAKQRGDVNEWVHFTQAVELARLERWSEALAHATAAVESAPRFQRARVLRALCYLHEAQAREALGVIHSPLTSDSTGPAIPYIEALVLMNKSPAEALGAFDKALTAAKSTGDVVPILSSRARLHRGAKRWALAHTDLSRVLELRKDSAESYVQRAEIREIMGKVELAKEDYRAFLIHAAKDDPRRESIQALLQD